jgi:hypothetical protein
MEPRRAWSEKTEAGREVRLTGKTVATYQREDISKTDREHLRQPRGDLVGVTLSEYLNARLLKEAYQDIKKPLRGAFGGSTHHRQHGQHQSVGFGFGDCKYIAGTLESVFEGRWISVRPFAA